MSWVRQWREQSPGLSPKWLGFDFVLDVIRRTSLSVLYSAAGGFSQGTPVFPTHQLLLVSFGIGWVRLTKERENCCFRAIIVLWPFESIELFQEFLWHVTILLIIHKQRTQEKKKSISIIRRDRASRKKKVCLQRSSQFFPKKLQSWKLA